MKVLKQVHRLFELSHRLEVARIGLIPEGRGCIRIEMVALENFENTAKLRSLVSDALREVHLG